MQVSGTLVTALCVADPAASAAFSKRLFGFDKLLESERRIALNVAGRNVLLLFKKGATEETASANRILSCLRVNTSVARARVFRCAPDHQQLDDHRIPCRQPSR